MTPLNPTVVHQKFKQLDEYLEILEELRTVPRRAFVRDHHHFGLAEHYLQLSIEVLHDVARYVLRQLDAPIPDESSDLLSRLAEQGVVTKAFAQRHAPMAKYRNLLVHQYADVDHAKTYTYLQKYLPTFRQFQRQITRFLTKHRRAAAT